MPVQIEPRTTVVPGGGSGRSAGSPLVVALINNMPDTAVHSTEAQFGGLLEAAAGSQNIRLRFSSFPELPRAGEAREHIDRTYWPLAAIFADPPDAVIVTGTEPRAPRLDQEPYWQRFVDFLDWAQAHTLGSIWSCLAAHAAVLKLDGIERQRLAEKRCGVYAHSILAGHPLLQGVTAPMPMPHSRWNELSAEALRSADYTLLSWSAQTGADAFVRQRGSLMLFFQGHPEYEDVTLLKEYRRDVGRYLNAQQPHYPTLPHGYLSPAGVATLEAFRERALAERRPGLLESFPFAAVAGVLENTWKGSAVALYRNWLAHINSARTKTRAPETVSLVE
jgi:homoserine O-succinyltransferase/O-acetyltransferase